MSDGRALTQGEVQLLRSIFRERITYAQVRIFDRRWTWPFPNDRAMAPNGNAYFPGDEYAPDFSLPSVPLGKRATFVHEATHLYQWYGLNWPVWARGPFERNYEPSCRGGASRSTVWSRWA